MLCCRMALIVNVLLWSGVNNNKCCSLVYVEICVMIKCCFVIRFGDAVLYLSCL